MKASSGVVVRSDRADQAAVGTPSSHRFQALAAVMQGCPLHGQLQDAAAPAFLAG